MKNISKFPEILKNLTVGKVYQLYINNQWSYPYISPDEKNEKNAKRLKINNEYNKTIKGIFLGCREEPYKDGRNLSFWTKWFAENILFWTAIDPNRYNSKIILIEQDNKL